MFPIVLMAAIGGTWIQARLSEAQSRSFSSPRGRAVLEHGHGAVVQVPREERRYEIALSRDSRNIPSYTGFRTNTSRHDGRSIIRSAENQRGFQDDRSKSRAFSELQPTRYGASSTRTRNG